jgi:vacuolar-type H+-ATPase subunit E/Vma4
MANEQNERDILEDLLSGVEEEMAPAVEELSKLIERFTQSSKAAQSRTGTASIRKNRISRPRLKKKTTHYISVDTSDALEEAKEEIRTLVSPNLKRLISKSRIVEMALQYVLKELAEKGTESKLVAYVMGEK